jgi:GT2 family glycosyltransferase
VTLPPTLVLTPVSRRPTQLPPPTVAAVLAARITNSPIQRRARSLLTVPARDRVSIVVPSANNLVFLKLCLTSIVLNTAARPYEVIVVDNGSTDGTADYLADMAAHHPQVRAIHNPTNRGFAPAVNQGLSAATGGILVLLNDDTVVPPGWLGGLCRGLDDTTVGLLGPVTNRSGDEAQIEVTYNTYAEFLRFARGRRRTHRHRTRDLPMLTMFCLAFRRDVYERIGPLDEQFEIGMFEDDDYAARVRDAGYRVVCADALFVHHFGATSLGKLAAAGEYGTLFGRNKTRFEQKWRVQWTPRRRAVSPAYAALIDRIRDAVARSVPANATVAVISRGDDALLELCHCRTRHFPSSDDGSYAGYNPGDSEEAIGFLARARHLGASFLVVPQTATWWLAHYTAFAAHLRERARAIIETDACTIFEFTPDAGGGAEQINQR